MAKQEGPLQLRGTLEKLNFYKLGDTYYTRKKGGADPKRIKNDPEFQRTRENAQEFKSAANSGKLLRDAIRSLLKGTAELRMHNRMLSLLMKIVDGDASSERGCRKVSNGPIQLLEGFEFNKHASFSSRFPVPINGSIDRVPGAIVLDVPSIVPSDVINPPPGASHYKLVSAGVAVDFNAGLYSTDIKQSEVLPINNIRTAAMNIIHNITSDTNKPILLIAGIQFLQEINGIMYPLKNSSANALKIVKVDV